MPAEQLIRSQAEEMLASFETRANDATRNVGGSTEEAINAFVERTNELSTLLSSHTQSLEDLIENSTRPLLERLTDDGSKLQTRAVRARLPAQRRTRVEVCTGRRVASLADSAKRGGD